MDDIESEFEIIDTDGDMGVVEIKHSKGEDKNKKSKRRSASTGNNQRKKSGYMKFLDMRHILGFLNQSEWVNALNIGNIMQITPIQRDDLTMHRRNE